MDKVRFVKHRDVTVDIVRSLAIAFMVAANMAVIGHGVPPYWFRLISSMAAPIFISLACMMVVLGVKKNHHLGFVVLKCLFLFGIAVLLDLSNELLPLKNIDVLYLIGLLLIISHLASRLSYSLLLILMGAIVLITPYIQYRYGYTMSMAYDIGQKDFPSEVSDLIKALPHRYLIDGWFPLLPWVSLCFFSVTIAKLRYNSLGIVSFAKQTYVLAALALILVGGTLWYFYPGAHAIRYHYIELFYPPVSGFMIFTMGVVLGLIALVDYIGDISIFAVIHPLGEASLFMYIFHLKIIYYILEPLGSITFGLTYFSYYLVFISSMIVIGLLLRWIRNMSSYRKSPHIVRWIFG